MDLLPSLRAFCSVAEQGSLTRSAAALGVATSALSRQIGTLEAEARVRLFHRTGRGVVLTEPGARLLPQALSLLAQSESLVGALRGESSAPVGTVDIGVVPAVRPIVARLCARLQKDYPRMRLRALEGFSGQVEEWVASGKIDVGLFNRYGRGSVRGAEALLHSPMVLVGRRGLPVVKQDEVGFRQLAGVPLAIPIRPNALLTALEATALRFKVDLAYAFESGSEAIIMDAVAHAGLCTVVPRHVAVRDYGSARFSWALLAQPRLTQVTWMAQTSAHPASPASRIVAGLVRELAPALASGEDGPARLRR